MAQRIENLSSKPECLSTNLSSAKIKKKKKRCSAMKGNNRIHLQKTSVKEMLKEVFRLKEMKA
jgi:hypothetical protein